MKTTLTTFRPLALAAAALLLLTAAPRRAPAAFTFTLTETAGNVVVNGTGTLNLTALNFDTTGTTRGLLSPNPAGLYAGPTSLTAVTYYSGLTGPTSFGGGAFRYASTGSGDLVGFYRSSTDLLVPSGYVSGTPLTDTSTYTGQTFASLGFTPGTYTYTWGSGANADSLTVTSVAPVPEPATWAAGALTVLAGGLALRRRLRAA